MVNPHHPALRITLRQLATHTSSITDRRDVYASLYRPTLERSMSLHALLRSYLVADGVAYRAENFLTVAPGASRDCSNLGATLAAYIVERIAGEPLDAHTRRLIVAPLALHSAGWNWAEGTDLPRSGQYVQDEVGTRQIEPYVLASYPDGGLQMSVEDIAARRGEPAPDDGHRCVDRVRATEGDRLGRGRGGTPGLLVPGSPAQPDSLPNGAVPSRRHGHPRTAAHPQQEPDAGRGPGRRAPAQALATFVWEAAATRITDGAANGGRGAGRTGDSGDGQPAAESKRVRTVPTGRNVVAAEQGEPLLTAGASGIQRARDLRTRTAHPRSPW